MNKYMEVDRLEEVAKIVREKGTVSASFLQRRLRVGYAVAAKYVDLLEESGLVTPFTGSHLRIIKNLIFIPNKLAANLMYVFWLKDNNEQK